MGKDNGMNESRKSEYLRVFYHELGHWIVAKCVGFYPGDITVHSERYTSWSSYGNCNTVLYKKCSTIQDVSKYLIDRQLVLLAGAVFEVRLLGEGVNKALNLLCNGTANDDYKKFMELAVLSFNLKLGEKPKSIDVLMEEANGENDEFYNAIVHHREKLLLPICQALMCENILKFIESSKDLFEEDLGKRSVDGTVVISGNALNKLYESENIGFFTFENIVPFERTILDTL